jgi:hypothetical protein
MEVLTLRESEQEQQPGMLEVFRNTPGADTTTVAFRFGTA